MGDQHSKHVSKHSGLFKVIAIQNKTLLFAWLTKKVACVSFSRTASKNKNFSTLCAMILKQISNKL